MNTGMVIDFPTYTGVRCLMMPYVQGYSASVPEQYHSYKHIIDSVFLRKGDIGYAADLYPYKDAILMNAGEVHERLAS